MRIEGYFGFDQSLALEAKCLGKKIPIKINGFKGRLLIPSLPKDFSENSVNNRIPLTQPKSKISFNENIFWGRPYSWPSGDSELVNFKLELKVKGKLLSQEIKEDLLRVTHTWINNLRLNLFAYNYLLEYDGMKVVGPDYSGFEYYFRNQFNEPQQIRSGKGKTVEITLLENPICFKTFKGAIKATSQDKTLSDEYLLLRSSALALQNDEYRKSIFETASALELCLTNLLNQKLQVNNDDLKRQILKMNNSIEKKIKLLSIINETIPENNYQKDVSEIRNRAIHIGATVSKPEAKKAYNIVKQLLDSKIQHRIN